jgi:hypothetical protein
LATTGWIAFDDPAYEDGIRNAVWIGATLRSWETRFGARLLAIGPGAQIQLLVSRPPRAIDAAKKIAAEHSAYMVEAFCLGTSTGPAINFYRNYSLNNRARPVVRAHGSVRFAMEVAIPASGCGTTRLTITWHFPIFIPQGTYTAFTITLTG